MSFVFAFSAYAVNGYAAHAKASPAARRLPPSRLPTSTSPASVSRSKAIEVAWAAGSVSQRPLQPNASVAGTYAR